jgi:hypothetical protein
MISDVKAAIVSKLQGVYPDGYVIYDEELPETISRPSFLITLMGQSYNKRLFNKYTSELSFDITYLSDQTAIRSDCLRVQEDLLQAFDFVDTFKVRNKNAKVTDNVLHFTFGIRYSELKEDQSDLMQQKQINTNL